ncbi:MAG: hypothetical protein A2Y33_03655 [Spirochaetes bacterium GWF1_51_8]|nr:MAG: hypothetical protein A2Y33_03655 [Spirochaetes bacterium GWF1_51_8]
MTRNAQFTLLIGLFTLFCLSAGWTAGFVTIDSVKIVIDGKYTYLWSDRKNLPEALPGSITEPYTITTLLSFYPGQILTESKLKKEVSRSVSRLLAAKYFAAVQGSLLPVDGQPDTYQVVIEIVESSPVKFGGGLLYGTLTLVKLGGKPFGLRLNLGYNLTGAELGMKYLLFLPFHIKFGAFYRNNGILPHSVANYHLYTVSLKMGIELPVDWMAGMDITLYRVIHSSYNAAVPLAFIGPLKRSEMILSPYLSFAFDDGKDPIRFASYFSIRAKVYLPLEHPDWKASFQAIVAIKRPLKGGKHSINFQLSGGFASAELPYLDKFNIRGTVNMSVRSDQPFTVSYAENYALLNIEYRFRLFEFFLPPVFDTTWDAYLFTDFGVSSPFGNSLFQTDYLADAYGAGLRVHLADPFALSASLSLGLNRFGEFRAILWGTSGF